MGFQRRSERLNGVLLLDALGEDICSRLFLDFSNLISHNAGKLRDGTERYRNGDYSRLFLDLSSLISHNIGKSRIWKGLKDSGT